jgi:Tol biopolymer transport system component
MPVNTGAAIVGKSEDGKWFQVAFPDAAHPAWVPGEFVTVTGTIDQLPVVAVAPPPTATRGAVVAAATKPPAATPTQAFPPARGSMGFVVYDNAQNSYLLYNLTIEPRSYGASRLMGPAPFDLAQNTNAVPFAIAPNSARVAYVFSTGAIRDTLRVTNPSNPDIVVDIYSHQGISSPTFSPDGKTIAYVGLDKAGVDFGMQFIYTIPADGGTAQRFFPADQPTQQQRAGEVYRGVAWGKTHLLFASNLTGQFEIWRLNGDGGGPMQLTKDKRENISPTWSPDGKTYAYVSKQVDGSYQIMVANAFDSSAPRKVTNAGHNFSPTWSPDGNWIAFMSNRGGKMDIWVTNKNGGSVQLLTDKFAGQGQAPGGWR